MNSSSTGRLSRRPRLLPATVLSLVALGISVTPAWVTPPVRAAVQHAGVTITLAGPNQWNNSGTSFGQPWEQAVATFEKLNPGLTFKTNVLPLTSFFQTEATLLQAGSAPELIFNQTNYKPFQVVALNKYLMQPNPYAPGKKRWIDWFDQRGFSTKQQDTNGNWDWIPFNFVDAGLFINESAFAKAGVKLPIATWEDWRTAVKKLKAAGYTPLAMDGSYLGIDWTWSTIANMLTAKYFNGWNKYKPNGAAGTNDQLVIEDYVRALKTGVDIGHLPELGEALTLTKEVYTDAATANWSGIKGLSGAGVDLPDFTSGKAAMAWAVNFGVSELQAAKPTFKVGSIGWPTITKATTSLSTNEPARFGVTAGGTSYMIPSTTKGDKLNYAVKFLQYMTAPKYNQPWITATNGAASVKTVKSPANISGFSTGQWGQLPRMNVGILTNLSPQNNTQFQQIMQGYLLGSTSLSATEAALQSSWKQAADYQITQNPKWKSESWAK